MNAQGSSGYRMQSNALPSRYADTTAAGAARAPRRSASVLVATARQSLVRTLQRTALAVGLTLVVSPDGLHTLMSAVRDPPALIILDPDVPGVEAETIERRLARDSRTVGVPVLRLPHGAPDEGADDSPSGRAA